MGNNKNRISYSEINQPSDNSQIHKQERSWLFFKAIYPFITSN